MLAFLHMLEYEGNIQNVMLEVRKPYVFVLYKFSLR